VYSTIDGLATGGELRFSASSGEGSAELGQRLPLDGPVTLRADTAAPPDARITLFRDGKPLRTVEAPALEEVVPPEPAVYRVEVSLPRAPGMPPVPWMVGNPIYVGKRPPDAPALDGQASRQQRSPFTVAELAGARIERSMASEGATSTSRAAGAVELLFRYALGGKTSDHPYVAAVLPLASPLESGSRIHFTGRADRPMRLSVQVRRPGAGDGDRWRRSIYLDETVRDLTVALTDMRPVTGLALEKGIPQVDSLLFVVDDENTRLGNGGRVWIRDLELVR
jgi:hypothetical protein